RGRVERPPEDTAPPRAAEGWGRGGLGEQTGGGNRAGNPPGERPRRPPPAPIPPRFTPPLSTPSPMDHELSPVWTRPGGDGDSADINGERERRPDERMEPAGGVEPPTSAHNPASTERRGSSAGATATPGRGGVFRLRSRRF